MTIIRAPIILALIAATATTGCASNLVADFRIEGLQNPGGAEISGLAVLGDFLLLLPQHEARIYWMVLAEVDQALENAKRGRSKPLALSVHSTELSGSIPPLTGRSGWEAVVVESIDGEETPFLADEDETGNHSIYRA